MERAVSRHKRENEKFCMECGQIINVKAEICPKCGVRQMHAPSSLMTTAPNGKSKFAAAILAFLLGGLGIHKFYLGQPGWGVVYILFCWTFIPMIVGLVEAVLLLFMDDGAFDRKYGGRH